MQFFALLAFLSEGGLQKFGGRVREARKNPNAWKDSAHFLMLRENVADSQISSRKKTRKKRRNAFFLRRAVFGCMGKRLFKVFFLLPFPRFMTSDKEGKKTASAKEREEKDLSSVAKRK